MPPEEKANGVSCPRLIHSNITINIHQTIGLKPMRVCINVLELGGGGKHKPYITDGIV